MKLDKNWKEKGLTEEEEEKEEEKEEEEDEEVRR